MSNTTIPRAKVTLPTPQVHPKHPFRKEESHQQLLDYIKPRLNLGRDARNDRLPRMVRTDKSVAGWMKQTRDDAERQRKQDESGIPQALTMNLPLNFVQLDDMMTYYAQTFAPNRGMFYQMGKPDEDDASSQIVTLMNNNAIYAGYYRHVLLTIYSTLKYNLGGFTAYWSKDIGPKLAKGPQNNTVNTMETIWQGNRVESLDMYNTFWDPLVTPSDVYKNGEWGARVDIVSHYWLQNKCAEGLYYNCEEALRNDEGLGNTKYYLSPPEEANMIADDSTGTRNNWVSILSETSGYSASGGYERVEMFIKLNPIQLNLVSKTRENAKRNRLETWRITLLNDKYIIDCTYMSNVHGYIPFFMGMLNDDSMGTSAKSSAEIIQPLQDFASFLLNTHVQATRKNIWGLTIYDKSVVDLSTIPNGEVSARIPAKVTGAGKRLDDAIYEHKGTLDTKQTMQDLEAVMGIINVFFPTTSMPSQIADIDRAVNSQVAAVQQGANRRMQKGARLLDDTMFRPLRFALYYNLIQFQSDGVSVSDFYGRAVKIDLSKLRETDLPFVIGQGLKAIDRQAAASQMQNIIFAMIQNPATAQRVDLMAMIDYWTSMIDIDIDMKQFTLPVQPPAQGPGAGIGDNGGPPFDPNAEAAAAPAQVPPEGETPV